MSQACYGSWPCSRWGEPGAATAGSLVSSIGNRTTPAVNELTQKLNESNSARDQAVERIDLLIAAEIARARRLHAGDEQFRGLYISEAEVDLLLRQPVGQPRWAGTGMAVFAHGGAALDQIRLLNRRRSAQSVKDGIELRLECLERCFGLDPFEVDALLVCLAVEMELRYEKLYAYLQGDVTKKRPSVGLVLNLLARPPRWGWRPGGTSAPRGRCFETIC